MLEPVDGNYDPVPPGESSDTVLLTNLANRIQPVVRYDLGDGVTLREEPCPCGSPFPVVDIAGRQGEMLRFETDDGDPVPVFPLALSSVGEAVPGVRRTQLVRTGRRTVRVHLDVAADHDEATVRERVAAELRAFFAERSVTGLTVEWAATPPQREPGGGKFRHAWSDLASDSRD